MQTLSLRTTLCHVGRNALSSLPNLTRAASQHGLGRTATVGSYAFPRTQVRTMSESMHHWCVEDEGTAAVIQTNNVDSTKHSGRFYSTPIISTANKKASAGEAGILSGQHTSIAESEWVAIMGVCREVLDKHKILAPILDLTRFLEYAQVCSESGPKHLRQNAEVIAKTFAAYNKATIIFTKPL